MTAAAASFSAVLLATAPVVPVDVAASCADIDAAEVRRVVAVELRLSGERETAFATTVRVHCDGTTVHLNVADALSRKKLQRTIELDAVADVARSRTLALAIAELVTASWSELSLNPEPRVEPGGLAPPDAEREAARERTLRRPPLRLLLEGGVETLFGSPLLLYGAGLRVGLEPTSLFSAEVDLRIDHGNAHLPLGNVMADRAALGLSGGVRGRYRAFGLKGLLGVRGGAVRLIGEPLSGARAGSGAGPWLGVHLGGAATLLLGPFCAELGVEVGAPLVGVVGTVDGATSVPFNNAWLGARLALGVRL